jgi:hypothetical protein
MHFHIKYFSSFFLEELMKEEKEETVNLRIGITAYEILNEIRSVLVKEGKRGKEVSFKKIIEDALKLYYKTLTGKNWNK